MKRRVRICVVSVVLALVSPALALAAVATKQFHEVVPFKTGGKVTVNNVNGSITVETWDQENVEVNAEIVVKARSRRDAEDFLKEVEIILDRSGDRLRIEPDYPKREGSGLLDWVFGRRPPEVTVNFRIRLPQQTDVVASSVNGRVTVSDVQGDVKLHTTNGSVEVRDVVGSLSVQTVNGSVKAKLLELPADAEVSLKTVNGGIRLYLPEDVSAEIEASTVNGGIDSEFPIEVRGKYGPKHASGRVGEGDAFVTLKTVNGSIQILKR